MESRVSNPPTCQWLGWLTSQSLIIVEHKPGKLGEGKRKDYALKNFENAQIKNTTLTAQFQNKKVKIQLPAYYKKSKTT